MLKISQRAGVTIRVLRLARTTVDVYCWPARTVVHRLIELG